MEGRPPCHPGLSWLTIAADRCLGSACKPAKGRCGEAPQPAREGLALPGSQVISALETKNVKKGDLDCERLLDVAPEMLA
jgi:hypothetical protein